MSWACAPEAHSSPPPADKSRLPPHFQPR